MKDLLRTFVALWYLLGWLLHVYLGLFRTEIYSAFGQTALIPGFQVFWQEVLMPRMTWLALLLAGFELLVGLLLVSRGSRVKVALILSIGFNLFLLQLGLAYEAVDITSDFLWNRLPNLALILLQIPLFWGRYPTSIPERLRAIFN